MAGIGFTLRKVIARGEMGSTVQAALSGILIVAGPWILSIITLSIVNRYMGVMMAEASGLFIAQLVYTYSASLILFSPIHLLFTRLIADLIWEDRESEASRLLLWFCAFTGLLSLIIAIPAFLLMPLSGLGNPMLFRWGAILFFLFINLIWVILLFNSLLRWYGRILGFMSLGMAVSVGLIWLWGSSSGTPDHRHCRVLPIVVGDHHQLPVLLRAVLAGHENRRTVPAVESSTHHLRRSAGGPGRSLMDPAAGNQHHTVGDHGLSLRLCKFRGEGPEYGSDHTHQVNSAAKS
jgi:uncharacterized membrane protein